MNLIRGNLDRFSLGDAGSNAYGLGSQATASGHGMVLGNPHFPWQGSQRFYQSHLTIPGKADVAGASLFGVPIVLIGHTRTFAWSHTVSTARRFTPFELKLVPGSPTSYLYDGQVKQMDADRVTVQVPGPSGRLEPRSRTLYSTVQGPVFTSILGLPLFPWTSAQAHAMGDANAANFRYLNHFFETNLADSVREYDRVERRNQGIPWVNSIAADSRGEAYYADIGAIPNVPNAKAAACNSALGTQTTDLLGIPILDGSRSACRWDNDPDALQPGTFGPRNMPSLFRRDYVTNSNDSYWLSNPEHPLEGFARIIGDERTVRSLRTRLGLRMVQERLAGTDGRPGRRFTLEQVQDTVFNNRQYAGELFRDQLVTLCKSSPTMTGTGGPVDVSAACPVLERWNLRDDLDSRGAVLFRRFAAKLLPLPGPLAAVPASNPRAFAQPFDVSDPVNTPRGLSTGPETQAALADAVKELRDNGIPLDARLREYQYELRNSERVPIHGGPGTLGVFNAISRALPRARGLPRRGLRLELRDGRAPERHALPGVALHPHLLAVGQPQSPYFADQTRMFSDKRWVDMRFCPEEVLRDRALRVTELGCVSDSGLRSVRVRGARGGRVRLGFRRRVRLPVTVEVLRASPGRLRRVVRVRRARSFVLRRRLRAGSYVARFTALGRDRQGGSPRGLLPRARRRACARRAAGSRCASAAGCCGRPRWDRRCSGGVRCGFVMGWGAGRGSPSRWCVGGGSCAGVRRRGQRPGVRRLSVPLRGLGRGTYGVRIVVRAGGRRSVVRLAARRL